MVDKITNGFEYQGGAEDGKKVPYRISDLVITSDCSLTTQRTDEKSIKLKIKREHTQLKPFSLDNLGKQ